MTARERFGLLLTTVSLVLWAGGLAVLGALVAPRVFLHSGLARADAAAVMAPVFLGFDRWVQLLMAILIAGEFLRLGAGARPRALINLNVALLVVLLAAGAASTLGTNPQIDQLRRAGAHRGEGPTGARLEQMHGMSERLGRAQAMLALLALGLAWIPSRPVRAPRDAGN
ncbi:MAG: DUF4149 domain-containing protein [Candidatus Eisenbacteria bacterium]|nr:DUF4149 domain-containing protein [Candidatus Eisenbacteria bacterium]